MPKGLKHFICDIIAVTIYLPFILLAKVVKLCTAKSQLYKKVPLSYYLNKSFTVIRNDALDRFGTPLEHRFSKSQIEAMMTEAGLGDIVFSDNEPYWHVIGKRKL